MSSSYGQKTVKKPLDTLERKLVIASILRGPNRALPFHIHLDALNKAIGVALGQFDENLPYAIHFISKKFVKGRVKLYGNWEGTPSCNALLKQI